MSNIQKFDDGSAEIVTELAAQMAVRLARHIHDGELLVRPANPKP